MKDKETPYCAKMYEQCLWPDCHCVKLCIFASVKLFPLRSVIAKDIST